MKQNLIDRVAEEENRGKTKWGNIDRLPIDMMIAIQEEIGEVAHAINHNEGTVRVKQEIAETIGLLSRLYDMASSKEELDKTCEAAFIDQAETPTDIKLLHIYSQPYEHADARIIGTQSALLELAGTIMAMLHFPNKGGHAREMFATDGEGYNVEILVMPDSWDDPAWKNYPPHYCDRGYDDDTHKGDKL